MLHWSESGQSPEYRRRPFTHHRFAGNVFIKASDRCKSIYAAGESTVALIITASRSSASSAADHGSSPRTPPETESPRYLWQEGRFELFAAPVLNHGRKDDVGQFTCLLCKSSSFVK